MIQHYRRRQREEIHAILFTAFLLFLFVGCLAVSVAGVGPLVLGTELNADGTVEYLCLGAGCKHLP